MTFIEFEDKMKDLFANHPELLPVSTEIVVEEIAIFPDPYEIKDVSMKDGKIVISVSLNFK